MYALHAAPHPCSQGDAEVRILIANARSQMSQADSEGASTVRPLVAAPAAAAARVPSPPRAPSTVARYAMPPPATSSKGAAAAAAAAPSVLYRAFDVDVEQGGVAPAPSTGREILWVQVIAAVGIPALDSDGKSDPFCVLTLEPVPEPVKGQPPPLRQRLETRHCGNTCEPVWGECFSFALQVGGRVGGTRAAAAHLLL